MDSAQKILIDIATVSKRVVNTLVGYVGRKTIESFRLDKIVVGSGTVLQTLNKALLNVGDVDDRLVDWLKSEEPHVCLQTLNRMEEILNRKPEYGLKCFFTASHSAHAQNNTNEAIRLFQTHKGYFHFLLTAEIWNRESGAQHGSLSTAQPDISHINQTLGKRGLSPALPGKSVYVRGTVQDSKASTNQVGKGVNVEKLNTILGWLNACNSRDIHERTVLLRQRDTCTWLHNTHMYKTWRSADSSFLWLHGKAGAGKSVLAASVVEDVKSTLQDGEVLVYFYCDFRNERSTSSSEAMRSLLSQLLHQLRRHQVDPGDLIDELVEEKEEGASTLNNIVLLARHVCRAAKQFVRHPFLVIDGLDECKDVESLLGAFMEMQKGGIRLFVTSRPLQIMKDTFIGLPSIDMEAMNHQISADIKLHVTRELDSHRRLRIMDVRLKDEIFLALCKKAGGMFRWVQCQLNTLKQCLTAVRMRETLNNLPGDLDATYERIILNMSQMEDGRVARRALDWLVVALCPMELSQIMESLSIDLGRRVLNRDSGPVHGPALLDVLGSLVTYDEMTDIVMLSHFSVKEYLIGESIRINHPVYHINERDAHTQLALLCMCYISIYLKRTQPYVGRGTFSRDISEPRASHETSDAVSIERDKPSALSLESYPLLEYGLSNGFKHLAHVSPRNKTVLRAIQALQLVTQNHSSRWEESCRRAGFGIRFATPEHDLAFYVLIVFAPNALLRSFIRSTKLRSKDGTNPLIYAARFCKIEHARTLLSSGVSLNQRGWHIHHSYQVLPLEIAVEYGDRAMVDLFLARGSPVPHNLFVRALWSLCPFPACNVARVLQTDEFVEWAVDARDEKQLLRLLDPVQYFYGHASEQDMDIMQRRLVQIGCDLSAAFDETSLRRAARWGHVSTVKHILSLNIPLPSSILLDASRNDNSNSAMIRFLISVKCHVDVALPTEDTPLHLVFMADTSELDRLKSVQALTGAGCNPLVYNKAGDTPLHLAAEHGCVPIIDYFLSLPVILPPDVLLAASKSRNASTIRLLVDKGADVHVIAANGNNPLHIAFDVVDEGEECLECAEILVNAGCNPRLPNAIGETPFDVAAKNGHFHVVEYFLSINLSYSPSVLLSVAGGMSSKASSMIKLLVSKGADIHVARPDGDTPLHLAANYDWQPGCLKRVQTLVDAGCDSCACNSAGQTPFHRAAAQGLISVMKYLLLLGISMPSDVMLTQVERCLPYRTLYYRTVCFLLDQGGDVHTIARNGDTLLHLAATISPERDALELTKHLVHAGCAPQALNSAQETPLHTAAQNGYITIIEYFLSLDIPLPPDILLSTSKDGPYSKTAKTFRYLIDKGANIPGVTKDGDTALHILLTRTDEVECRENIKILVDAGCDLRPCNHAGETPMHVAARSGFTTILEYLLSRDVPLPHDILRASSPSTIRFLLGKGIDVRCVATNADMQLMHRALDFPYGLEEIYLECAKILVGAGWDPSSKDSAGETPMHIATRYGQTSTIQYLLSQSVPLPSDILLAAVPRDGTRDAALSVWLIHFLIREGANVNAVNSNGDTPLHLVLRRKAILDEHNRDRSDHAESWKLVETLLDSGSDPSARNGDGQTPFDVADANGRFFKENFVRLVQTCHRARS